MTRPPLFSDQELDLLLEGLKAVYDAEVEGAPSTGRVALIKRLTSRLRIIREHHTSEPADTFNAKVRKYLVPLLKKG